MTKYKVEKLSKEATKAGYVGMNKFAAKSLGFPWRHKKAEHVVEVKPGYTENYRKRIIHHEETEEYFMKNRKYKYKKAHNLANKFEAKHKPFPSRNTKRVLKKIGIIKK
ncbi:MAG TPA: hypothetical protein VMC07_01030 [Candidatus Omnitrophota bacterium]|nr:hypothetical protein [Candidatus Omnitrophota bacterium]